MGRELCKGLQGRMGLTPRAQPLGRAGIPPRCQPTARPGVAIPVLFARSEARWPPCAAALLTTLDRRGLTAAFRAGDVPHLANKEARNLECDGRSSRNKQCSIQPQKDLN